MSDRPAVPDDSRAAIDAGIEIFEGAWKSGQSPEIEPLLGDVRAEQRDELLKRLLLIELSALSERGQQANPTSYAARFPDRATVVAAAFSEWNASDTLDGVDDLQATVIGANTSSAKAGGADRTPPPATPLGDAFARVTGLPAREQLPMEFGDYVLLEVIARGGMGVVYQAQQKSLNRTVAIKMILSGQLAGDDEVQRFHKEAEAAAQLDHPHIVPIYEVGEHEGRHFFSMGFVDGPSLHQHLIDGPLPPRDSAKLLATIAGAVHYAHEQGVVHRDLKPGNVLLEGVESRESRVEGRKISRIQAASGPSTLDPRHSTDPRPRITDFGLAKMAAAGSDLTASGQALGTPSYMPPEQARGDLAAIDARSDVYSLGAVLYCLLTGGPPFKAASAVETLRQVQDKEPVSPRDQNEEIDRDLETICLKCLQKEPEKRYQSAADLTADLHRYLNGEPILARPVGRVERLIRWCRRNRVVAGLTATVVVLVVSALIGTTWGLVRLSAEVRAKESALGEKEVALGEKDDALRKEERRTRQLLARQLADRCRDAIGGNNALALLLAAEAIETTSRKNEPPIPGARETLAQALAAASLSGFEYRSAYGFTDPQFTGDGERLAALSGSFNKSLKVWRFRGPRLDSEPGVVGDTAGSISEARLSADGKWMAVSYRGSVLRLWRMAGGKPDGEPREFRDLRNGARFVEFSPDSKWLAAPAEKGTLKLLRLDGETITAGKVVSTKPLAGIPSAFEDATAYSAAFSPDGKLLALGMRRSVQLWVVASTGARRAGVMWIHQSAVPTTGVNSPLPVAFNATGRWLFGHSPDTPSGGRLWHIDPQSGRVREFHLGSAQRAGFSPDGRWLVTRPNRQTLKLWSLTGEDPRKGAVEITAHRRDVDGWAIRSDGSQLATVSSESLRLWNMDALDPMKSIELANAGGASHLAFTPNGRLLIAARDDRKVQIWSMQDPTQPQLIQTLKLFAASSEVGPGVHAKVQSLHVSPAGDWFAVSYYERGRNSGRCRTRVWGIEDDAVHPSGVTAGDQLWAANLSSDSTGRRLILQSSDVVELRSAPGTADSASGFRTTAHVVSAFAVQRSGRWLAAGNQDGTILLCDLHADDVNSTARRAAAHNGPVKAVAFSPSQPVLATGGIDGIVRLWRTDSQLHPTHELSAEPPSRSIRGLDFSGRGRWLVIEYQDQSWGLCDLNSEPKIVPLPPRTRSVVILTSTGRRVRVVGSPGRSEVRIGTADADEARERTLYSAAYHIGTPHVSDDERWMAAATNQKTVLVWDLSDPQAQPLTLGGYEAQLRELRFLRDSLLATRAYRESVLRVWDLSRQEPGRGAILLKGHTKSIEAMDVSPNGDWIATAGDDGSVRLWYADRARLGQSFSALQVRSGTGLLQFSPDGRRLLIGSRYGSTTAVARVVRRNERLDQLIELARATAGRDFSAAERRRYLLAADNGK